MEAHEPCDASELIKHFAKDGVRQKRRAPGFFLGTEITRQLSEVDPKFVHIGTAQYTMYVIFNIGCYGWHYGWRGGRFKQNTRHVFSISVVYAGDNACKVLGEFRSSEFRVVSVRHNTVHAAVEQLRIDAPENPSAKSVNSATESSVSSILSFVVDGGDNNSGSGAKKRTAPASFSAKSVVDCDSDEDISELAETDLIDYSMLILRHGSRSDHLTLEQKRGKRKPQGRGGDGGIASKRAPCSKAESIVPKALLKPDCVVSELHPITPELTARAVPTSMSMNPEASAEKQRVPRSNGPRFMATPDGWTATTCSIALTSSVAKSLRNTARADVEAAEAAVISSPSRSPVADSADLPADVIDFLRSACASPIFRHSGGNLNTQESYCNSAEDEDALRGKGMGSGSKYISGNFGSFKRFDSGTTTSSASMTYTSTCTTLLTGENYRERSGSDASHNQFEPDIGMFFSSLTPYQI